MGQEYRDYTDGVRQDGHEPAEATAHGPLDVTDAWQLTDAITRLRRILRSSVRSDLPWETLPMAHIELLQRLSEEPELGVSQLAARQRLAVTTVSTLVQQMVSSGTLSRASKDGDRRSVVLRVTALGDELLGAWKAANAERLGRALDRLPGSDHASLMAALPALVALAGHLEADEDTEEQAK